MDTDAHGSNLMGYIGARIAFAEWLFMGRWFFISDNLCLFVFIRGQILWFRADS